MKTRLGILCAMAVLAFLSGCHYGGYGHRCCALRKPLCAKPLCAKPYKHHGYPIAPNCCDIGPVVGYPGGVPVSTGPVLSGPVGYDAVIGTPTYAPPLPPTAPPMARP